MRAPTSRSTRFVRAFLWGVPVLLGTLATACKPNLGSPPSIVETPRLLAVRGLPAEAKPNASVSYDVLAVDVDGRVAAPAIGWVQCEERKPPAEGNAVAAKCLTIEDVATGPTFVAMMPPDACKKFGPQADLDENKVPIRPRDPDSTGGFYQPVRAIFTKNDETSIAFALERLTCPLANAPSEVSSMFASLAANLNPTLAGFTLDPDGDPVTLYTRAPKAPAPPPPSAAATYVGPSSSYELEVSWADDSPEPFPVWNGPTKTVDMHREAMSVSWYATAGEWDHDRTGRGETEPELTTRNRWTSPATASLVHFWIVLRDSRGGIDFAEAILEVRP
jgi:hypothetical protein